MPIDCGGYAGSDDDNAKAAAAAAAAASRSRESEARKAPSMSAHFNGLSPAQAERLAHLIEELAEAQQAACKVLRHGYASADPTNKDHPGNRADLENELKDVLAAIQRMTDARDVQAWSLADTRNAIGKSNRYMHHQPIT